MGARQDSDNLAWDRSDELFEKAREYVRLKSQCQKAESVARRIMGPSTKLVFPLVMGGFNVLYPMRVEDRNPPFQVLVRLCCPDQLVFPEEKTFAEAAMARYIEKNTRVPVPKVFHCGIDPDPAIGPFTIIQDLGSRKTLCSALETPRKNTSETPVLNPNIPEESLRSILLGIAKVLLQLAQPTFPRMGALELIETTTSTGETTQSYHVTGRPITLNMNNMVTLSNVPPSIFPPKGTTYQTADEWYVALAEMQIATLVFQHNDMVSSEDDCRKKYVARQLFHKLARQGRLSSFGFAEDTWSFQSRSAAATLPMPSGSNSFRLWSDDFRPANIVCDKDDNLLGCIDWEFAYIAPTQFVMDPPWWLLLDVPEMWEEGIENWERTYEKRLETWLLVMEEAEKEDKGPGQKYSLPLSVYMRQSWTTGRFWLDYAARKSWAFDTVYWKYLDERFFGLVGEDVSIGERWRTRVSLLSPEEQAAMETMVQIKVEESKERILVEYDPQEAKERLASFLFN